MNMFLDNHNEPRSLTNITRGIRNVLWFLCFTALMQQTALPQELHLDVELSPGRDETHDIRVSFLTQVGASYVLQQSRNLRLWQQVGNSIAGDGLVQEQDFVIGPSEQYFRLDLARVEEFELDWPVDTHGSTHEVIADVDHLYITGQNMHHIAKISYSGDREYFALEDGSGPHGILLDKHGELCVSLEFKGSVVRLDNNNGAILEEIDVRMKGGR